VNYSEYLRGSTWRRIRGRVLRRDRWKCRSCGQRASQVHHGAYDEPTMRGETLARLYSLCGPCHEAVSLDVFGLRRPAAEVRATTRLLDAPVGQPKKRKTRTKLVPRVMHCGTRRIA